MKLDELDPIVLSEENTKAGITESCDSTPKKVIYQIPFSRVNILATVLKELEARFGSETYIDVELCSLEDAYINIAKEEERLLEEINAAKATT